LIDAGKRLFELYNFAVDRINEINNADIQTNIMKQLTELMSPILEFRMEKELDKTMASLLLRTAMVLATDTIRCTPQLNPDTKTLLSGILDRFINGIPNAASFFVGFDKDNVFSQFIKKFMDELVSKDTDIIKQLKKIATIVNSAFL